MPLRGGSLIAEQLADRPTLPNSVFSDLPLWFERGMAGAFTLWKSAKATLHIRTLSPAHPERVGKHLPVVELNEVQKYCGEGLHNSEPYDEFQQDWGALGWSGGSFLVETKH